jgi:hypothetical protein
MTGVRSVQTCVAIAASNLITSNELAALITVIG